MLWIPIFLQHLVYDRLYWVCANADGPFQFVDGVVTNDLSQMAAAKR